MSHVYREADLSRRGLLLAAGAGLAGAGLSGSLGLFLNDRSNLRRTVAAAPQPTTDGMPGPFPGRVVQVDHPGAVSADYKINRGAVQQMVQHGMRDLTGSDHGVEAWRRLFEPGDVVGIKVNPVGRSYGRNVASISSHELVIEVVEGLKSAGVRPQDIILYDRYARQFRGAGYEKLLGEPMLAGVRWYASSVDYTDTQLDIEGYDGLGDSDPHVVGYDPDVFAFMGYANPGAHAKDDRRFRSHLSVVITRMVNKLINLPVLKDHGSAGVTLALKNLSHGLHNNVCRSHLPRYQRAADVSGPNQCNTFIPTVVAQAPVRQKTVLHILDGLIGVYQGGPSSTSGCIWPQRSLFFATDPVALDHIGWDIVDAKRVEHGMHPVGKVGLATANTHSGKWAESFDRRQPEHIILAGSVGLGVYDRKLIDHRRMQITDQV